MARTCKPKSATDAPKCSTSNVVCVPEPEHPKARRRKTTPSKISKKKDASRNICEDSSIPILRLGFDENKENEKTDTDILRKNQVDHISRPHRSKADGNLEIAVRILRSLNSIAGNPIHNAIDISSVAYSSLFLTSINADDTNILHTKEKKIELINIARRCLQTVNLMDLETTAHDQMASLNVAICCLRSVNSSLIPSQTSGEDVKARVVLDRVKQLYFHSISISEAMLLEFNKSFLRNETGLTSDDSLRNMSSAMQIGLSAFQGLGHLIQNYHLNVSWKIFGCEDHHSCSIFPVPVTAAPTHKHATRDAASLPWTDFRSIIRTLLSVTNMIKVLHPATLRNNSDEMGIWNTDEMTKISWARYGTPQLDRFAKDCPCPSGTVPVPSFLHMIPDVLISWVIEGLKNHQLEEDAINELSSYVQRGFRILWDASKEINSSYSQDKSRTLRLRLQQEALLLQLFYQQEGDPGAIVIPLIVKALDQVCKMANECSFVYFHSRARTVDEELVRFHQKLGFAIDHAVSRFSSPSVDYVEYCARRAMHLSLYNDQPILCDAHFSALTFPFYYQDDNCIGIDCEFTTSSTRILHLVYLTISATGRLLNFHRTGQIIEDVISGVLTDVHRLGGFSLLAANELLFIYRLLIILELTDGYAQRFENIDIESLRALRAILCNVFVPVIDALRNLRGQLNKFPDNDAFEVLAVNLLLMTIYVLERLQDFMISDGYIKMIADWLCHDDITGPTKVKLLEHSAKILYNIGKMREGDENCMLPFVTSTELFTLSFNITRKLDYKISDRYAYLAKLFSTLKMTREATITAGLSVVHLVSELSFAVSDIIPIDTVSDVLLFIDDHLTDQNPFALSSFWTHSSADKCRTLIHKLVLLLNDEVQISSSSSMSYSGICLEFGWSFSKLLREVYENNSYCVKKFISLVLLGNVDRKNSKACRLSSDVVKVLIWELARCIPTENGRATHQENFQEAFFEAISFFDSNGDTLTCIELNAIAGVALYSNRLSKCYSRQYLCEALRLCHSFSNAGVIQSIYRLALGLCLSYIHSVDREFAHSTEAYDFPFLNPPPPRKIVDSLVQDMQSSDTIITLALKESTVNRVIINVATTVLTKASLILYHEGYSATSPLKFLEKLPSLCEKTNTVVFAKYAHGSSFIGHQLYDKVELGGKSHDCNDLKFVVQILSDVDRLLTLTQSLQEDGNAKIYSDILSHSFALEALTDSSYHNENTSQYFQEVQKLAQKLSDSDMSGKHWLGSSSGVVRHFVTKQWTISCYNFLYRHYERTGYLLRALKYLRLCCCESQKLLKMLNAHEVDKFSADEFLGIFQSKAFSLHMTARIGTEFMGIASLYARLGDPSKSLRYSLWAAETMIAVPFDFRLSRRSSLVDIFPAIGLSQSSSFRQQQSMRNLIDFFLLSSPYSKVDEASLRLAELSLNRMETYTVGNVEGCSEMRIFSWFREAMTDLVTLGDMFARNKKLEYDKDMFSHQALSMSLRTGMKYAESNEHMYPISLENFNDFICNMKYDRHLDPLTWEVAARIGLNLYECNRSIENESSLNLFRHVASATTASSHIRALSNYYLGISALEQAKYTGEIYRLWRGHCNDGKRKNSGSHCSTGTQESIHKAREYFHQASFFAGPASSSISREIMRYIALVTGPGQSSTRGYSASEILHSSIGSSARSKMSRAHICTDQYENLFSAFDVPLYDEGKRQSAFDDLYSVGLKVLPSSWFFLALSMCPSGELLMATIRRSDESQADFPFKFETICIFPTLVSNGFNIIQEFLEPYNQLMEQSSSHLAGSNDLGKVGDDKSKIKAKWWEERKKLDFELKALLDSMDERLFSYACVQELLAPICLQNDNDNQRDLRNVSGNLALKFEAMCAIDSSGELQQKRSEPKPSSSDDRTLFLILDEFFLSIPLEGLFTFRESSICRIPSLPFAIARCCEAFDNKAQVPYVDLSKTTYVLDPESNLLETRDRMQEFFDTLSSNKGWCWNGFVGDIPSDEVIEAALKSENSLYLFCGHGGGESFYPRSKFDRVFLENGQIHSKGTEASPKCDSAIVLMGCSSGRLTSVNADGEEFAPMRDYHFEPDGAIVSYLCAGAPCVVANLWDVTDRDIDRYLQELMSQFSRTPDDGHRTNLATCVARARSACKMSYIVGCAPVIYGVPVINVSLTSD